MREENCTAVAAVVAVFGRLVAAASGPIHGRAWTSFYTFILRGEIVGESMCLFVPHLIEESRTRDGRQQQHDQPQPCSW